MATDNRIQGQKFRDTLLIRGTGEVPTWGGCSLATWIRYGDALLDVLEKHPDVPLENIDAILSAISDYQNHWVNKG